MDRGNLQEVARRTRHDYSRAGVRSSVARRMEQRTEPACALAVVACTLKLPWQERGNAREIDMDNRLLPPICPVARAIGSPMAMSPALNMASPVVRTVARADTKRRYGALLLRDTIFRRHAETENLWQCIVVLPLEATRRSRQLNYTIGRMG